MCYNRQKLLWSCWWCFCTYCCQSLEIWYCCYCRMVASYGWKNTYCWINYLPLLHTYQLCHQYSLECSITYLYVNSCWIGILCHCQYLHVHIRCLCWHSSCLFLDRWASEYEATVCSSRLSANAGLLMIIYLILSYLILSYNISLLYLYCLCTSILLVYTI